MQRSKNASDQRFRAFNGSMKGRVGQKIPVDNLSVATQFLIRCNHIQSGLELPVQFCSPHTRG